MEDYHVAEYWRACSFILQHDVRSQVLWPNIPLQHCKCGLKPMISVRVISLNLGQTRSQSAFNLSVLLYNAGYISAVCSLCLSWDIIKLSKCYSLFKWTPVVLMVWFHRTPVTCCAALFPQSTESWKQCFLLVFSGVFTFVVSIAQQHYMGYV